jgi:hypothetical protein
MKRVGKRAAAKIGEDFGYHRQRGRRTAEHQEVDEKLVEVSS